MQTSSISTIDMLLNADPVVKAVMILLFLASLWCWLVIFEKIVVLKRIRRNVLDFNNRVHSESNITDISGFSHPVAESGFNESRDTAGNETRAAFRERMEAAMRTALVKQLEYLEARTLSLATIGSTAPFIGLFGTVWGIMHSFASIAESGESSLAVVAPGIAEALFATAMGLVAAVPAVIAFNKISAIIKSISRDMLVNISLYSNQLARRHFVELKGEGGIITTAKGV